MGVSLIAFSGINITIIFILCILWVNGAFNFSSRVARLCQESEYNHQLQFANCLRTNCSATPRMMEKDSRQYTDASHGGDLHNVLSSDSSDANLSRRALGCPATISQLIDCQC